MLFLFLSFSMSRLSKVFYSNFKDTNNVKSLYGHVSIDHHAEGISENTGTEDEEVMDYICNYQYVVTSKPVLKALTKMQITKMKTLNAKSKLYEGEFWERGVCVCGGVHVAGASRVPGSRNKLKADGET